ncbi:MAG: type I glutamate--ammonia ligase [Alphaproteobacteria bacterium]
MAETTSVIERIEQDAIQTVDFRFTDLRGRWQHVGFAAAKVSERLLEEGIMFDGSAVPGWRDASESDMMLIPDLSTAVNDPFSAQPTLLLIANVAEPGSGLAYERCPRSIAAKAMTHLEGSGVADEMMTAAQMAFSVFDDVRSEVRSSEAFWRVGADEGRDSSNARYDIGNSGHRFSGTAPYAVPPADHFADLRAEIVSMMQAMGLEAQQQHHNPSPCQCEINLSARPMLASADGIQIYRYVVQNVAHSYGKTATFMAKPLAFEQGASFEIQQALWHDDKPIFAGHGYADLSELCLHFIGGILQHAQALNAFTNPTTNSYRRLAPGQNAPRHLAYAAFNRSAALRLPFAARPEDKRVELRFPDPSANAYLAFSALLMAGLDGIARRIDPGEPMDRNLYDLPAKEIEEMPTVCRTLDEALTALDRDRAFLTKGEVFSDGMIDAYIALKRTEIQAQEAVPHPVEYQLYYSV